jgi:hypothetical protein
VLRLTGRLTGVVTEEHFHDLGKLLFAFMVLLGVHRVQPVLPDLVLEHPGGDGLLRLPQGGRVADLSMILVIGHFIIPFLILISRKTKRNVLLAAVMAAYLLVFQVLDMIWIIRPVSMAYASACCSPS